MIKQTASTAFVKTTQRHNQIKLPKPHGTNFKWQRGELLVQDLIRRLGEIISRELISKIDFNFYWDCRSVEQLQSWHTKAFNFALQICFEPEQLRLLIASHSWSLQRNEDAKLLGQIRQKSLIHFVKSHFKIRVQSFWIILYLIWVRHFGNGLKQSAYVSDGQQLNPNFWSGIFPLSSDLQILSLAHVHTHTHTHTYITRTILPPCVRPGHCS